MNVFQLLNDLEHADPEFLDRTSPRRQAFKYLGNAGKKITAAAVPAVLASFFNRAYGQTTTLPTGVQAVLNLALQLEYLEFYFYDYALGTAGLVPSQETSAITTIRNDEAGHINSILGIPGFVMASASTPVRADYDYSGGNSTSSATSLGTGGLGNGPLAAALTVGGPNANGALFFAAAQSFADTGVRAYKGGAPILNTTTTKDILEAALNIHSVEARHNSHFRTVRRAIAANTLGSALAPAGLPETAPKSWITLSDNDGPTAPNGSKPARAVYGPGSPATGAPGASFPAESNTLQAGLDVTTKLANPYSAALASESFDEPLDAVTVKTIARMFISPTGVAKNLFA